MNYELVGLRNGTLFNTYRKWLFYEKQGKASMDILVVVTLSEDETKVQKALDILKSCANMGWVLVLPFACRTHSTVCEPYDTGFHT